MTETKPYVVSARKYRPSTFKSVVGQRALTATLKNAISGGRLAQAYLFCGPRGVGKTSCARIFAKTINCLSPTPDGEACGECESCKAIDKGNSFNLVELDAASNNSVDDIRNITDQVNVPPQNGKYRVFIIDEVHMLSNSAFNAFLKTLEEPPKNVVFILATTERHKVIPTILSRCQIYDFRRITVDDIIDHLEYVAKNENIEANREALGVIALKADGAMRDALSVFDQVAASTGGRLTYESTIEALNVLDREYYFKLVEIFRKGDVASALLIFREITDKGFDAQFFVNGLASHIRDMMMAADSRTASLLETSEELEKRFLAVAPTLPAEWYYKALDILNDCDFNYRVSGNKRLLVELALIKLSRMLNGPFETPDAPQPQERPDNEPSKQMTQGATATPPSVTQTPTPSPLTSGIKPTGAKKPVRQAAAGRATSFRLTDQVKENVSQSSNQQQAQEFTQEDFMRVWNSYIGEHPDQRILISAMRSFSPQMISKESYKAVVAHPAQQQAYESAMGELLSYLRQELHNDKVTLMVELAALKEDTQAKSPKEFLKEVLESNEELSQFLKNIDAEFE